ncbi:MAG: NAD(+) synthase [Verrucomicrobiota bacterium]|nr:NAD(+) synthase [Verrucomicrobiota bacterium]
MHGFYRMASAVPTVKVADTDYNTSKIIELAKEADKQNATTVVFPELSVTGYTCADLFHQNILLESAESAILTILKELKDLNIIVIVGVPIFAEGKLYNTAAVLQHNEILGIVPKIYIPNYREYYEKRWFASGKDLADDKEIIFAEQTVPFGNNLIFSANKEFTFGIEICEDLWNVIPPSSELSLAGATAIMNLSASNELVSKADYRRSLIQSQSARCVSAYIYSSAGVGESTTDLLFGGHTVIAENGRILKENERFQRKNNLITADIDCRRLQMIRLSETSFSDNIVKKHREINTGKINRINSIKCTFSAHPFVPKNSKLRNQRCKEIFQIQAASLAKRLEHTAIERTVLGISGGLDSTLALLVINQAFELLNLKKENLITVTMPGFGTSERTLSNATALCKIIRTDFRKIDIKESCLRHFRDIGHNIREHNTVYENVQARERTMLLMNIANKENALVIGTGDLSEIALGWSTYNGDHMSMYAVNCSIPKTLVKYLIRWVADRSDDKMKEILLDIIDTPVSPELLPSTEEDNSITQKTEELIGPYELHDFFLYHTVKYGASPEKIIELASIAFKDIYDRKTIQKWNSLFIKRFFSQQFKRSCIPDGPKVGTISLSPRGDWRMPSDASAKNWIK